MKALGFTGAPVVGIIASLIEAGDDNNADVFIFDKQGDALNFYNKIEGWHACKLYRQTGSICRTENACLNMLQFGFRNNNNITDLKIYFEVVAIVNTAKKSSSGFDRDNFYNECMAQKEIQGLGAQNAEMLCNCMVEKITGNANFTAKNINDFSDADIEKLVAECAVDVGLVTKTDLNDELLEDKLDVIEHNSGKSGVIKYCEEQIKADSAAESIYTKLAWYCLLTKQFTKAKYYIDAAEKRYPVNLYIKECKAHWLLLTGNKTEALSLYRQYLNENMDEGISWKEEVKDSIEQLKNSGIENEAFTEIEQMVRY